MVHFLIRIPKARMFHKALTELSVKILKDLGNPDAELSVLITDDEEIRVLNSQYRSIDRATDVLSFSQMEGEGVVDDHNVLGDIVISWDRAESQGKEYGHGTGAELERLLVHGLLHLFGYDHEGDEKSSAEMKELENRYLGYRGLPGIEGT